MGILGNNYNSLRVPVQNVFVFPFEMYNVHIVACQAHAALVK